MELEELRKKWQQQNVPVDIDTAVFERFENFDATLKKQNLKLTFWLAGTIYATGIIVFPFLERSATMLLLGGIWFLVGFQALIFWLRQTNLDKAIIDNPEKFITSKIARLQYNLWVTNLFMPIYMVLLGVLSSLYLYKVLEGFDTTVVGFAITGICVFYVIVFYLAWRKQRTRGLQSIIPQIVQLKKIRAGYIKS